MKKTVFINIAGTTFHIDEDAYEVMNNYLQKLNSHFNGQEGGVEIIKDIEGRIAELFIEERIKDDSSINIDTASRVIKQLGDPSLFDQDDEEDEQKQDKFAPQGPSRKLFRFPQKGVIGGVLSGLSVYANINIAFLRLLLILSCFVGGLGIGLYIVLWIIIPKARTRVNYMQMRGIAPTVDNIQKHSQEIDEEMMFRSSGGGCLKWLLGLLLLPLLLPFFVVLLVIILILPLVLLLTATFGHITSFHGNMFSIDTFELSMLDSLIVSGLFVIPLIVILIFKLKSIKWDLRTKRWVGIFLLILWVGCIMNTVKVAKYYIHNIDFDKIPNGSWIKMNNNSASNSNYNCTFYYPLKHQNDTLWITAEESITDKELINITKLNIKKSSSNNYQLKLKASLSKGKLTDGSKYYKLEGDTLYLPVHLYEGVPKVVGLNMQLKVPTGRTIFLDKSISNILDDVKNLDNTWDYEMTDHFWKQLPKGLKKVSE
ncbi:PspC domain-containing protein [Prolixibacteraceae bacterium]|nr:PspC domain-containing protein [Prolixibacteraceae bacterium]